MDWGLFECFSGDNKFLREEIVYSSPKNYQIMKSIDKNQVLFVYYMTNELQRLFSHLCEIVTIILL